MSASSSLVILENSVQELNNDHSLWVKVDGYPVQEAKVVAIVHHQLRLNAIPETAIEINATYGIDLIVYEARTPILAAEFKRTSTGKRSPKEASGILRMHWGDYRIDISRLCNDRARMKALVVFDPQGLLSNRFWDNRELTVRQALQDQCDEAGVRLFVVGAPG